MFLATFKSILIKFNRLNKYIALKSILENKKRLDNLISNLFVIYFIISCILHSADKN